MAADRSEIVAAFRLQAEWCERLGSPFTARLSARAADEIERGGRLAGQIGDWPGNPNADGLPLRFAGALHALVLSGEDPGLAAVYPPHDAPIDRVWPAVEAATARRPDHFARFLASPPQTNEVRRSALLLPGFLEIARRAGKPLRLLEIGGSAGLNLIWDRYRYRYGDRVWGDPASPLELDCEWRGEACAFDSPPQIVSRAACDRAPIDLNDAAQIHRLRSYIWADQPDRLARLDGALALFRQLGFRIEPADAADWLDRQLADPAAGAVTVIYHSVVWQYLPKETRQRIRTRIETFGKDRPLAWLALEIVGPNSPYELRLRLWPGDGGMSDHVLAEANPHGMWLKWMVKS